MDWHATTILSVRRGGRVAVGGDGQVTLGNTVVKANARKVRRLGRNNDVLAGFAGATADAFTLFELFEAKLDKHGTNLPRAASEPRCKQRGQHEEGERKQPACARHGASLAASIAMRLPSTRASAASSSLGWISSRVPATWLAPYGVPPLRVLLSSGSV